jgi:hypothetical protein
MLQRLAQGGLKLRIPKRASVAFIRRPDRYFGIIATDLVVTGAAQPRDDKGMVTLQLTFRFVNCGRSPAKLTGFVLIFVINDKLAPTPNYENPALLRFMIAPNGQYGSIAPNFLQADANDVAKLHMGQNESGCTASLNTMINLRGTTNIDLHI